MSADCGARPAEAVDEIDRHGWDGGINAWEAEGGRGGKGYEMMVED